MKSKLMFLVFLVCVLVSLDEKAIAQSQPADSYSYSGLAAGIRVNAFGEYAIDDFIFTYLNESGSSEEISTTLTSTSGNSWADCSQTGSTFSYDTTNLSDGQTYAWNVINQSVLASGTEFTGSFAASEIHNYDFYIGPPTTFTVSSGNFYYTDVCTAYLDTWNAGSWTPPWFWDGGAVSLLVSPYAAYYNNDNPWAKGWNTSIEITNGGSSAITYTVDYVSDDGGLPTQQDTQSTCQVSNLSDSVTTPSVAASGGTWSSDLGTILSPTSLYDVQEDGAFTISLSTVIAGSTPQSTISPNSSGTAYSCGSGACTNTGSSRGYPMVTSCY